MYCKNKIVFFIVLSIVTIVCHACFEQYIKTGPDLLSGKWQHDTFQKNNIKIIDGRITLYSEKPSQNIAIRKALPSFKPGTVLMLSADMMCKNVIPGEQPWNKARLLLVQNDGKKNRWDLPHGVAAIDGTSHWDSYRGIFVIETETQKVWITAQLSQCTGTFNIKNIRLHSAIKNPVYLWVQKGILTAWAVFGLFLLGSFITLNQHRTALKILLILSFAMIIIGTTLPKDIKTRVSSRISDQLSENSMVLEQLLPKNLPKTGHFLFFAAFAGVSVLILKKDFFLTILANLLMIAGGTELAQFFVNGRGPLVSDFLIDAAGGLLGMGLVIFFRNVKLHDGSWH